MSGPASTRGLFVAQFARAAAERGRLDPPYQLLSGHYTRMMQKLYPVWVLLGPGLADPAHIEVHSRTVWMDSDELLGDRATIASGTLDPFRILVSIGVAIHEVFHGVHTKPWVVDRNVSLLESGDVADRQLAVDRRLLEEPRMEATGVRDYPAASARGKFIRKALRAAAAAILVPSFLEEILRHALTGEPVSRDLCGKVMTYLHARVHCGTVDPAVLAPLTAICGQVLGTRDMRALDDLFARLIWVEDGDQEALDRYAREYRDLIGPPPTPPPTPAAGGSAGDGAPAIPGEPGSEPATAPGGRAVDSPAGDGESTASPPPPGCGRQDADGRTQPAGQPTGGSLGEALEQAIEAGRQGELRQLNEDVDLKSLLDQAAGRNAPAGASGNGGGSGMPTGRMPDRGVDRPPFPDEVQAVVQYVNRLNRARTAATQTIDKRSPGGRFNARSYIRGRAQRSQGQPVTSHPWEIRREVRRPLKEPHVGLVVDTSGSMGSYEYALGPIVWVLDTGLRKFGGRIATALFGNGCCLLSDGRTPMKQVPGIRTGGGTAFAGDAIELVTDALDIEDRHRPRLLYLLSDGAWADTEAGVKRVRWLRDLGVPTIHISIGALPPLSVQADRICVIDDPANAMDIIAGDTVEALRRGVPRPAALHRQSAGPAGPGGALAA